MTVTRALRFSLQGPATLKQARAFATETGRRLREWGLPEERVACWEVAVAEMATNVSKHGYPRGAPGPMGLDVRWDAEGVTISLRDEGLGFDPAGVPEPPEPDPCDPSTWPVGGMGLRLIRGAGDRLTYRSDGRHHVLSLFTAIPRP